MADFICIDNKGIVISANKVTSALDLQVIEKYVKSSLYVEVEHIDSPRLS